jgi:cytoskeletal protein CcmA (bactofilin family)
MVKNKENEMPSINLLGPGTVVKGEIRVSGDFRIDGTLHGSIECKGKVVVGPSGSIEGEIQCLNADFSGEVKANVKETARFSGDIVTSKLAIEPGAKFSGTCKMEGAAAREIKTPPPNDNAGKQ